MSYYLSGDAANGKNGECLGDRIVASPKDATALNDLRASGCVELGVDPVSGGVIFCCGSKLAEKGDETGNGKNGNGTVQPLACKVGGVEVKTKDEVLVPYLFDEGCTPHPDPYALDTYCCPQGALERSAARLAAAMAPPPPQNGFVPVEPGEIIVEEQLLEPSLVQRGTDFVKAHPFVTAGLLLGGVWAVKKLL